MISLTKKTTLKPDVVIKKAFEFFGPKGFGLIVTEENKNFISLEGGGGGVTVSAVLADRDTKVDIESREWDRQAQDFLVKIK